WKKKRCQLFSYKLLPGPFILCRMVPDQGIIRALLWIFALLEMKFLSKEIGSDKR
ncbi:unnamed protein product, partial [Rangifer tarandus platyrhynchus]